MKSAGIIAATVVAVSLTSPYARAQDAPNEFLSVLTVTVTPGMTGQFESFVGEINDAAGQIGDTRTIQAYQVRFGGPVNRYLFVTRFNDWGEVDNWPSVPAILISAHGEEAGAAMFQAGTAAVESFDSTISQTQHEFTNLPDGMPSTPARFARITRTEIAPGTAPAYLALISKRAEAQRHLGIPIIRRTLVEGTAGVYTAVEFYNTLAERDQAPNLTATLNELFGEAEMAQLIADGSRGVRDREFTVIEHRPDLSR
jgi:hypothetical protein